MGKSGKSRANQHKPPPRASAPTPARGRTPPPPLRGLEDDPGRQLIGWLFPLYILLIAAGVWVFRLQASMPGGNQLNFNRAVFASVNTATLTGFQQNIGTVADYEWPARVNVLVLTFGGGALTLIIGGLAAVRALRLPYTDRRVICTALLALAGAAALGMLGLFGEGRTIMGGASLGLSAFGNSGVTLAPPYGARAWQTQILLMPLAALGGLGVTVLLELYDVIANRRPLSFHARTALSMTFGLYLAGFVALLLLQCFTMPWSLGNGWVWGDFMERFRPIAASSSVTAINARTAGLAIPMAANFARPVQWVIMLLMFIGASPGGTGGGLKSTTVFELGRGLLRTLRGERAGRLFGIALCWLGIYVTIVFIATLALLQTETQMSDQRIVFTVISAMSNVGLSRDTLSMSVSGEFILCAVMLAGRLGALALLWWIADTVSDADLLVC